MKYYSNDHGYYIHGSTPSPELLTFLIGDYTSKITNKLPHQEIGPLLHFKSPWCTNALTILDKCGENGTDRIEQTNITSPNMVYDVMTSMDYTGLDIDFKSEPPKEYTIVPLEKFEEYNDKMSLSLDSADISYYTNLFIKYNRCPTDIELYDLAQSNSEHSRHSFFTGNLIIKDQLRVTNEPNTLMDFIKYPLECNPSNSTLSFCDNASAIAGGSLCVLLPERTATCSEIIAQQIDYDTCFTAETHNFPTSIAPFPGASTGTGGRIRDNQAIGRGGIPIAGTAGYCVGNLGIPGYNLPWEDSVGNAKSIGLASPLEIIIQASNGASDYGNKFGEPIIQGFTRSSGLTLPDDSRIEWLKPIMFTGGVGIVAKEHVIKNKPEYGMVIIRLGGPAYRIGMGGGSASSRSHSAKDTKANYDAVQRGDPEMENKVNRVVKSCINLGKENPIVSIHDQGSGGAANVTKEIVYPNGALTSIDNIIHSDPSLSFLEKWVCEYQEQVSILVYPKDISIVKKIAQRENCPISVLGVINNSGKIKVYDPKSGKFPVNLELEDVLGDIPKKNYILEKNETKSIPLSLPPGLDLMNSLDFVFRLLSVGSKRFLTNKVDRSVTGLIAQQQCVGPLHTPVSNVAVVARDYYTLTGVATAIGEQPMKGTVDSEIMARMSISEMLTNLMWAKVNRFEDIKCSGNWMWPGKDSLEGYHLYKAVKAVSITLSELGIAIDGGKDSMSMRVQVGDTIVKSPRSFVISGYTECTDILKTVTPDLKSTESCLFFIDISTNKCRTGGSALATVFKQTGDLFPDLDSAELLKHAFNKIQTLISHNILLSGHDRSDGGLIGCILEMCISGNRGCDLKFNSDHSPIDYLFAEELGIVVEVSNMQLASDYLYDLPCYFIGKTNKTKTIDVSFNNVNILSTTVENIRNIWENTSFEIEKLQCNPVCVEQEIANISKEPVYSCNVSVISSLNVYTHPETDTFKPRVAIIREEGSNGDAEMIAAFKHSGFSVWDVNTYDLENTPDLLDTFQGIVFVGGFSYSDVFGAAKGWAATIKFNQAIKSQFDRFYARHDTFSFGVCNGCQLMAILGWIPECKFVENDSGRFESRFSTVKINKTKSIMLQGMDQCNLGIWVAHTEGKCVYTDLDPECIAMQYTDETKSPTESYPFNPNGSKQGVTGVCSKDGRHLAMMPHPERCFMEWQLPYNPSYLKTATGYHPWFNMFVNAYTWCKKI